MGRGWFGMETDPFQSISRNYICFYTAYPNGPSGTQKLFWAMLFPQTLWWFGPGSHSLCLAAIFYATKTPQLYESKRDRQKEHSASLKNKESIFLRFCGWPLGLSLSELMFIYFLLISQFVVSDQADLSQYPLCAGPEELLWEIVHNCPLSLHLMIILYT